MSPDSAAGKRTQLSAPEAETIEVNGCTVFLRRIDGPEAAEIFLLCEPPAALTDTELQAGAIYRAIADVLAAESGSVATLVTETLFLRNLRADLAVVRGARQRIWGAGSGAACRHVITEVEQPPSGANIALQVAIHAVLPTRSPLSIDQVSIESTCGCAECTSVAGQRIRIGDESRFHASAIRGAGADAYEQTLAMFGLAEELLQQAGMEFRDVVRTWIHMRDIDRDYPHLNRARRAFFAARGISPVPASTGIGGAPAGEGHDICLGLYAVKGGQPGCRSVMTAPTLNEAPEYGADFVRGMKIVEANKIALHLSGTASIDEHGRSAHAGDFESQVERMLVNISALLRGQGAGFADVVSAITYVKRPSDAARMKEILQNAGFEGFPNAIVLAPICRPELLCEIEALAVLPHPAVRRRC